MSSDLDWLFNLSCRSIVAPAGYGKTELLAKAAAYFPRSLILTHTHAGVHAISDRVKRLGIPKEQVAIDTIASWASRYAYAFPIIANHPPKNPRGVEWNQVYQGALNVLSNPIAQRIVQSSYDRIYIDEYQDCESFQHTIAKTLARIVPTLIFGDPMQGIFEFVESKISWSAEVVPSFPVAYELTEPHRWNTCNPTLGAWIADVRQRLLAGSPIDLRQGPINYRAAANAFDMSLFFEGIDERHGSTAAIHCRRGICDKLARTSRGAYQAIEEMAGARLIQFGQQWDASENAWQRIAALNALLDDAMARDIDQPAAVDNLYDLNVRRQAAWDKFGLTGSAESAADVLSHEKAHPLSRTHRGELLSDARRALVEVSFGRSDCLTVACQQARQRLSHTGRAPTKRVVSTPLLLKGLEFDHVLIPDATHFSNERFACAKLFYVAISRARYTLSISSSSPILQFPKPIL
jgi:DNA helicase-2/ATP-dependent DNA helicase PcrA